MKLANHVCSGNRGGPTGEVLVPQMFTVQAKKAKGEDITDECLIFSGIDGRSLDPILKKLRENGATVKLKAMVTVHNQSWNVGELIKELRREHIYMNGGNGNEK